MTRAILALALALALHLTDAHAEPAEPPASAAELFDALAAMPGLRADYREAKHMTVLVDPVNSEGRILFAPPATLVRVTTRPIWSSLVVEDNTLVYRDAAGPQKIPAGKSDPARAFVDVFVGVARGDRKTLEETFEIAFAAADGGWTLTLSPRKKRLGIRRIELAGTELEIATMTILDAHGDLTEMTFSAVDTSRAPTKREIEAANRNPAD